MDTAYYVGCEPFFGEWRITRLIGEGSYGKVFEIYRTRDGGKEFAALKALSIPGSSIEWTDMLNRGMSADSVKKYYDSVVDKVFEEIRNMAMLKGDRNIVRYEDHEKVKRKDGFGTDLFIRMELLTPLNRAITENQNRIQLRDIIQLGIDICNALELCLKFNVIHRDVKLENIFVSKDGNFKLGDFGISRTLQESTASMTQKGTYAYIAPEIIRGERYGSSVDLYALGIVLYRLLNDNRIPFMPAYPTPITHGDADAAVQRRISGAILPPPRHGKGRLIEIIMKACAYRPEDRYSSSAEMRDALKAIQYTPEEGLVIYPCGDTISVNEKAYHSLVESRTERIPAEGWPTTDLDGIRGGKDGGTTDGEGTMDGGGADATWMCQRQGQQSSGADKTYADPECNDRKGWRLKTPLLIGGIAAVAVCIAVVIALAIPNQSKSSVLPSYGASNDSAATSKIEAIEPKRNEVDADTDVNVPVHAPTAVQTFRLSDRNLVTATEDFSAAIDQDGCVVLVGNNQKRLMTHGEDYADPQEYRLDVSDWRNVIEISGDQFHISGLMGSGRVISNGFDTGSGYVNGVKDWQNVVQVRTGYLQTLGLTRDGRILFAGWYKGNHHVHDCTEWTNVERLIGGAMHVAAVMSDGSVKAAGYNGDGRCDTAVFRRDVEIMDGDLGAGSTFVVYADGTVDMLGRATQWRGAVLGWSGVVAISANDDHVVGLREDGRVFYAGDSQNTRYAVESWRNVVAVAAGPHHVVGICEDGTLVAAGRNTNGQCDVAGVDLWDGIAVNPRQTFRSN